MKNIYQIILCTAILFPLVSWAQPPNDDCGGAIEISDLNSHCDFYEYQGATPDGLEGVCEPPDLDGIWFSFIAQGAELSIEAETPGDETAYLTVYRFNGTDCAGGNAVEVACATDSFSQGALLMVGERYFVKVAADPSGFQDIVFCIDNPMTNLDPPNDEPCFALPLTADSTCELGTTNGATFDHDNPACVDPSESSVWYKFTLSPNHTIVDLSVENLNIPGPITAMMVQFDDPDCTGDITYVDQSGDCDTSDLMWSVSGLQDEEEYFVQIATAQADTGNFRICVQERVPPPDCGEYNPCDNAYEVNVPPDEFPTYFTACNTGSMDGPTDMPASCFFMDSPTEWFSIDIDQSTSVLRILAESDELPKIQLGIYKGSNCGDLQPVQCILEDGDDGIDYLIEDVDNDATYFVAVTDALHETGFFDIGFQQIIDNSDCNKLKRLEVVNTSYGSPLEGPYQSGEKVTFCYEIDIWDPSNCNWLQGIVPFFGNGWDPSSFHPSGRPVIVDTSLQSVVAGNWQWYSAGAVEYNLENPEKGYSQGDPMPAGWYFVNAGSGGNDPDNSRGDGYTCDETGDYTWKVCFTVTALKHPQCDVDTIDFNCAVQVQTFSDSEIGSWNMEGCLNDIPVDHTADLNCCQGPQLDLNDTTTCVGQPFVKVFGSGGGASSQYFWNVIDNGGVVGVESGQGDTLIAEYDYEGPGPREVVYEVYGESSEACLSEIQTWTITVYPRLFADAGNVDSVCRNTTIILGGNPTASGGSPPYSYDWSHGLQDISNPMATIGSSSTYSVTVTDEAGCRATNSEFIAIYRQPTVELTGGTSICRGETAQIQIEFTGNPPFQYTLSINGEDEDPALTSQNTVTIQVSPEENTIYSISEASDDRCEATVSGVAIFTVHEPSSSDIEETICEGETVQIGKETFDESGEYQVVLEGQNSMGCDSTVNLDLTVIPAIRLVDTTIQADDGTGIGGIYPIWGGGQPPYSFLWNTGGTQANLTMLESGTYSVTVTDAAGCTAEFSFFVDMETATDEIRGDELSGISMYPNPLDGDQLHFRWDDPANHILRIIDYRGKIVWEEEFTGRNTIRLPWPDGLQNGLFYIEILTKDGRGYFPLIIHR